jgi:hypothetical protein
LLSTYESNRFLVLWSVFVTNFDTSKNTIEKAASNGVLRVDADIFNPRPIAADAPFVLLVGTFVRVFGRQE